MMKPMIKSNCLTAAGLLLALPTAYFICINILNESGVSGPYNASQPVLESLGTKESLGFNINMLILLGPVICFLLSVFQVLKIRWEFNKEDFNFSFTVHKHWFPILVAAFSIGLLAILFFYLLGENCNC